MSGAAGERRIVAVLIADVAGSTTIAERLGPERSKFLFDEVVRLMREEVERFGGTVAQLTGDGMLALFGTPTAHEDDSARAVRTALGLHESLGRYAAEVARAYGIELAARVAVNTGPVVIPHGEAPPEVLYNALGDTVSVAARLQVLGDLIVGPTTARQVHDWFELEELGAVELKGRREPVIAFRVTGVREGPLARVEPPLVGRERELGVVIRALDKALRGTGGIVSITGEPAHELGLSPRESAYRDVHVLDSRRKSQIARLSSTYRRCPDCDVHLGNPALLLYLDTEGRPDLQVRASCEAKPTVLSRISCD